MESKRELISRSVLRPRALLRCCVSAGAAVSAFCLGV